MGIAREYRRHSSHVTRGKRWKALRLEALRRDGWCCVRCGERRRLEVDHILPVRTHPEGAYDLGNLQVLCGACHARKTRIEIGLGRPNPEREAWAKLVRLTGRNPSSNGEYNA